jgi:hypothetical protein
LEDGHHQTASTAFSKLGGWGVLDCMSRSHVLKDIFTV